MEENLSNNKKIWNIAHSLETDMQYVQQWYLYDKEAVMSPWLWRTIFDKIGSDMTKIKELSLKEIEKEEGR